MSFNWPKPHQVIAETEAERLFSIYFFSGKAVRSDSEKFCSQVLPSAESFQLVFRAQETVDQPKTFIGDHLVTILSNISLSRVAESPTAASFLDLFHSFTLSPQVSVSFEIQPESLDYLFFDRIASSLVELLSFDIQGEQEYVNLS